ncbi:MAG: nucleoside phosphorylase [Crenarchaeota archaeon]|nr:nucleoside phosphorylase [Thermoproteota archaeon]
MVYRRGAPGRGVMLSVDRRVFRAPHYLYEEAARRIVRGGDTGLLAEKWLVLCGVGGGSPGGILAARLGCSDVSGDGGGGYSCFLCGGPRTGFSIISIPGGGPHVEELLAVASARNVRMLVLVGYCLGLRGDIVLGDVVVSSAALRGEDITGHYAPKGYPAAADPLLASRLYHALASAGLNPRIGVTATILSPYSIDPCTARLLGEKKLLCTDTHTSIAYVLASLLGIPAASILVVNGNLAEPITPGPVTEQLIEKRLEDTLTTLVEMLREEG